LVQDKRVYVWDLRSQHAQAVLDVPGRPYVCVDEERPLFAVSADSNMINVFDARSYQQGPLVSFALPTKQSGSQDLGVVTCMKFSYHQNQLMAVTGNRIFLMDMAQGKEILQWNQGTAARHQPMEASFSSDGKHVISGAITIIAIHDLSCPSSINCTNWATIEECCLQLYYFLCNSLPNSFGLLC
jgi:COMPASS component SWD2